MMTRMLAIGFAALLLAGPAGAATMGEDESNRPRTQVILAAHIGDDDSNRPRAGGDDSERPRTGGDDSERPRAILAASPDNPQCPESCGRSV